MQAQFSGPGYLTK
uniref:Uncharacterized protein n=1 Tax=Arundo donax TaxID=35708 RepID=A0A0A9F4L7_ARUDO